MGDAPPLLSAPPPEKVLRGLFLTLFLRGRSSRGLQKQWAPRSIGSKLALMLVFYALIGSVSVAFVHKPVFALSVYLHAMTFLFLGMFISASAGEILFNKEEADILMHRPVTARVMLWSKIRVLVEVSLWLAGALNLTGFVVGIAASDGGWLFPFCHAVSATLEALFCAGLVVVTYQLCLRWFGRERLEGLMTTSQVIVSVGAVFAGQIVPRVMFQVHGLTRFNPHTWWIGLLPPAWFAGLDDAIAGSGAGGSWALLALGVTATAVVLWMAFGTLAADYESGLQSLGETVSPAPRKTRAGRRLVDAVAGAPVIRWWLGNPVSRASFVLTASYLMRDRDVKLRVYPQLAPMLIMPVFMLADRHALSGGFIPAMASGWLGLVPLVGMDLLQYSQQWQASDIFRAAPIAGPAPLCDGARKAVLLVMTLPLVLLLGAAIFFLKGTGPEMLLILPGLIALPVYSLVPALGGSPPLSLPIEEGKAAGRVLRMYLVMLIAAGLGGLAVWALHGGWFWWFVGVESGVAVALYVILRVIVAKAPWPPME